MFRNLRANEIKCRVSDVKQSGLMLFLYVDASTVQDILDEGVGPLGWQRKHTRDNANCIISIYDEKTHTWVEKEDVGIESRDDGKGNDKKGVASDSFKRSARNWGIGRELTSAPLLWVKSQDANIQNGKCYDNFVVEQVIYDNDNKGKNIVAISIKNMKMDTNKGGRRVIMIDNRPKNTSSSVAPPTNNEIQDKYPA